MNKTGETQSKVITSNAGGSRFVYSHRKLLMWFSVALFMVVVVGGYLLIKQQQKSNLDIAAVTDVSSEAELARQAELAKKEFAKIDANRIDAAEKQLSSAKSAVEKSAAYIALANVASGQGDNVKAYEYAKQALQANESVESYLSVAASASKQKEYALAAEMYGKAANLVKQIGGDNAAYDYENYMATKQAMEEMK